MVVLLLTRTANPQQLLPPGHAGFRQGQAGQNALPASLQLGVVDLDQKIAPRDLATFLEQDLKDAAAALRDELDLLVRSQRACRPNRLRKPFRRHDVGRHGDRAPARRTGGSAVEDGSFGNASTPSTVTAASTKATRFMTGSIRFLMGTLPSQREGTAPRLDRNGL